MENIESSDEVPGFHLVKEFINPEEEERLLSFLDDRGWPVTLSGGRRVQQAGHFYNHAAQGVDKPCNNQDNDSAGLLPSIFQDMLVDRMNRHTGNCRTFLMVRSLVSKKPK